MPPVRGGGRKQDSPIIHARRKLWTAAIGLDPMRGVGRQAEVAVYRRRGRREGGCSEQGGRFLCGPELGLGVTGIKAIYLY